MNSRSIPRILQALLLLILAAALTLFLGSCGSDDLAGPTDTSGPGISITSPVRDAVVAGGNCTFTGTTSDAGSVSSLTWQTSTGHTGTVSGSLANWSAVIDLDFGDVLVTFTATDNSQNRSSAEISVISNHYLTLTQPDHIAPDGAITNQATTLRAFAALAPESIEDSSERTLQSVTLVSVGAVDAVLGTMTDDGNLGNGDDIEGDNVYSIIVNRAFPASGIQTLRVYATYLLTGGSMVEDRGALHEFQVVDGVSVENLQTTLDAGANAWTFADHLVAGGATPEQAAQQTVAMLTATEGIASATVSPDGNTVSYRTSAGLRGNVVLNPDGSRGGGKPQLSERGGPLSTQPYVWKQGGDKLQQVSNNNVMIFDAFNSAFAPDDEGPGLRDLFDNSECPLFEVNYLVDWQCTVDAVATFGQYGTIILVTHGGRDGSDVFFLTREQATTGSMNEWEVELLLGNLIVSTVEGVQYFSILPGFIENLDLLPDSVVYNGSCESLANGTMANVFLANGATTYLGYTKTVNSAFAKQAAEDFFIKMVDDGDNSDEAFTSGQIDPVDPYAEFVINRIDAANYTSELINAGFEEGSLSGWTRAGDGRVITGLGLTDPTEGGHMAIISTGLGYTVNSGSITAAICSVGNSSSNLTLSFDWNFFSEEFLEWCGSQYQDFFDVVVVIDGTEHVLLHRWIDDLCGEVSHADVSFDRGNVYFTGWRSATLSLPPVQAGQSLLISFRVGDVGDSAWDSAILIDNVRLQ